MSIASPTLIPRPPVVPLVLPRLPHIGPVPLPKSDRYQGRINHVRDLQREADDLSDEENDLEDCVCVRSRQSSSRCSRHLQSESTRTEPRFRMVYPNRQAHHATRRKERRTFHPCDLTESCFDSVCVYAPADDDSDGSSSGHTDEGTTPPHEENEDSGPDLDAGIEDMDEEQNSDEAEEGMTEEFEEEPSDM
jgi:hypothetical protein